MSHQMINPKMNHKWCSTANLWKKLWVKKIQVDMKINQKINLKMNIWIYR